MKEPRFLRGIPIWGGGGFPPTHHICGSLPRARGLFITLLAVSEETR